MKRIVRAEEDGICLLALLKNKEKQLLTNFENNIFKYDKIHTRDYHWKFPVHEVLWANEENFREIPINLQKEIWFES